MPASAPTNFPYPYNVVADALPRILPSLGFQVVNADWTTGMVQIRGSGTVMSAGERLTIRVGTSHPSWSSVQVDSGVRLGIITYARTSSNFDTILRTLGQYLDQYYEAYRAPEAPPIQRPPPPGPTPGAQPQAAPQTPAYPQQEPQPQQPPNPQPGQPADWPPTDPGGAPTP